MTFTFIIDGKKFTFTIKFKEKENNRHSAK